MPLPGAARVRQAVRSGSRFNSLIGAIKRSTSRTGDSDPGSDEKSPSQGQSNTSSENTYVEPPELPPPPPGGLIDIAKEKVHKIMTSNMDIIESTVADCNIFMTRSCSVVDRVVIFIGDSTDAPAGLWSRNLCVRSGRQGGGIHQGSLGSMLPFLQKCKQEKMGVLILQDIHHDSMDTSVERFISVWQEQIAPTKATHVFVVAYSDGGNVVMSTLRRHYVEMKRQLSGIAFIESTHTIDSYDSYALRKLVAQWAVSWQGSSEPLATRMKDEEKEKGCICFSSGKNDDQIELLREIVPSVFAAFKARWSGFRVAQRSTGTEKACYNCRKLFNMRRWRQHCRTCQNAVCDRCSSTETTRNEGQVRLCLTCKSLPSLVHWSRPRAVRTGEKESVFSDSAKPGKMSVDDFELMQVIGRGACGKVLLVQKKDGTDAGELYAMKVLKKQWVLNKSLVVQTMAERRILQEANHPFIVQLRYAFQNQDKLYMVMDYYNGGSLRQVLRRRSRFSITRAKFYLAEILLAISHLHSKDIVYRDLKLENIVVTGDGHVACTDFGLSKEDMTDGERTKSFVGTCEYLAPELIKKKGYGKAVDWWAFGVLTFEMIQGDSPFRDKVPTQLFEKILNEEPKFTDRFTEESKDLITKLLTKNPNKRLGCDSDGVEAIKSHAFFEGVDWDAILNRTAEKPSPPHRLEDVADASHIARAIDKTREAREELMPDSPVAVTASPKHFDKFSYEGSGTMLQDPNDNFFKDNHEETIQEIDEDNLSDA